MRVGKDCKPLTGTLRGKLLDESRENDYTAVTIDAPLARLVSPTTMETVREAAKRERAAGHLLRLGDTERRQAISVGRVGKPTRATVLRNEIEMRFSAFPETLFLENATEMREFAFRVAFLTGNVSDDARDGSFRLISATDFREMNQKVPFRSSFDSFPTPISEEAP